MSGWIEALARLARAGTPAILATVEGAEGSTPRDQGTRMLVTPEAIHDTIGGGNLEHRAIAIAREMLAVDGAAGDAAAAPRVEHFPLGPGLGQCCGGNATVRLEPVSPDPAGHDWIDGLAAADRRGEPAVLLYDRTSGARMTVTGKAVSGSTGVSGTTGDAGRDAGAARAARALLAGGVWPDDGPGDIDAEVLRPPAMRIVLFGAGHVGRALVAILGNLPCRVDWIDEREGQFPDLVPGNVMATTSDALLDDVDEAAPGSYFLVMTHSHAIDLRLVERILRRNDFRYCGLIGSATKRARFLKRLRAIGTAPEAIARLTCPIGIEGIPGKHPGEIAVAAVAEILRLAAVAADQPSERIPA